MKTKELGKKVWKEIERPQGYAFISDAIEEMDDKSALALIKISLQWNEVVIKKLKEIIKAAESKERKQEYEYEMFFKSEENDMIKIDGWYPIATDRIKHPELIDHYLSSGLLRRITKAEPKEPHSPPPTAPITS